MFDKTDFLDKNNEIKVTKKIVKNENNGTVQDFTLKFNEEMKKETHL